MRILIFWDSISEWFYDLETWWWANLLKTYFWKNTDNIEVWISAIAWDEIPDIINRLESVTYSFTHRYKEDIIFIFSIWINDTVTNLDESFNRSSIKKFKSDLDNLLKLSKKCNPINTYFLWLTQVNEDLVCPFPWSSTWKCYKNKRIKEFDDIIKMISKENSFKYIDIFSLLSKDELYDGLHPNYIWHQKIFKKVLNSLNY